MFLIRSQATRAPMVGHALTATVIWWAPTLLILGPKLKRIVAR